MHFIKHSDDYLTNAETAGAFTTSGGVKEVYQDTESKKLMSGSENRVFE